MGRTEQLIDGVLAAELDEEPRRRPGGRGRRAGDRGGGLLAGPRRSARGRAGCCRGAARRGRRQLRADLGAGRRAAVLRSRRDAAPAVVLGRAGIPASPDQTVKTVRARVPESFGDLTRITSAGIARRQARLPRARSRVRSRRVGVREREHPADRRRPRRAGPGEAPALLGARRDDAQPVGVRPPRRVQRRPPRPHPPGQRRPAAVHRPGSEATVKLVQAVCNHIYGHRRSRSTAPSGPRARRRVADAMRASTSAATSSTRPSSRPSCSAAGGSASSCRPPRKDIQPWPPTS